MDILESQLSSAREVIAKAGITAEDVAAIGIANQRETTILWDKNTGKPVYNAIVWQCRRTSEDCARMESQGLQKFFKDKTNREIRAYFAYALKFLEGRQCPDTFLSAVVHMDEKTPHLHLCFVPLTPDGRLSAKEIIGNRKNLVRWQDEFWQHMVKQYPELERGESASQTGREHIPPRIFKEMTLLTKQKEQLDALLVGINPFNGKSRAAEISKVLDSYIPNVARMKDQLRKYNVAFTKTATENEKLKEKNKTLSASLDKAKEGSVLKRLEDAKLRQDYEAALKTLDSIPPEVIRFYENRTQESVVRHDK